MGGIGALAQAGTQPTASQISDLEQLRSTGLRFDGENGIPHAQWLDNAESRNASPELKAQYRELVDIAGGRTDRPSLLRAMEVAQTYFAASDPAATASDRLTFERTLADNLTFQLGRLDPAALLTSPLQSAARLVLEQSGATDTEWGRSLDRALGQSVAFNAGLAEGVLEGGTDMVTGIATMAGRALQFGADNSLLGQAGDAVSGLTGRLPEWLETWTPSAARGAASSEALGQAMAHAVDYIASNSPAEVAGDMRDAIAAQWDSLRASHAAAAAQGPEAEARWWGQTIGRVGFEIGATFVPVAGQAGRIGTAARVADGAADAVRAADTASDAARVGTGVDDVPLGQRLPDPEPVNQPAVPLVGALDDFARLASRIEINLDHILIGEINRRGRAVGFHSRPEGIDPPTARMTERLSPPDANGVYTGRVEVLNPATGTWVEKRGFSSFYPDNLTALEIEAAIRNAYADALRNDAIQPNGRFGGDSGLGFRIEGFAPNGVIETAYPVRE